MSTHSSAATPTTGSVPPPGPVSGGRRLDVQGLRAVAVLLVVAYHSGLPISGGFVGVDVFFVISGYVIIALLYSEVSSTSALDLAGFYARRVRRILPALALVTTLTILAAWAWLSPLGTQQVTAQTAAGASLFVANWTIRSSTGDYFAEEAEVNPLLHTWSLSVEEQFYMVFPLLLVGAWIGATRRGWHRRGLVLAMLVALTLVTFLASVVATGPLAAGWDDAAGYAFYGSPFRVWEFAIGGVVAVLVVRRLADVPGRLLATAGLGAIAVSAVLIDGTTPFPGVWTLVPVLGTAAVIVAGAGRTRGSSRLLSSKLMVWLGDLSYSWYLWHWPAIVFASVLTGGSATAVLLAGFGSLLPAWLSFRLLEQPLRTSGVRGRKAIAVAVVCIGVPLAAAAALYVDAENTVDEALASSATQGDGDGGATPPGSESLSLDAAIVAQQGQWVALDEPCLGGGRDAPIGTCLFGDPTAQKRVLLVGDSHAGAYSPGVIDAAQEIGASLEVITSSGCPFMDLPIARRGSIDTSCQERVARIWDHIVSSPPDVVVIAHRSPRFISPTVLLVDEQQSPGRTPCVAAYDSAACLPHTEAVRAWASTLGEGLKRLMGLGSETLVLQTVPEHESGLERCIIGTDVDLGCLQTPRTIVEERRDAVIQAERDVVDGHSGQSWDPIERYCDDQFCDQVVDGHFHYRNDDHLNTLGSRSLAGDIAELLRQSLG